MREGLLFILLVFVFFLGVIGHERDLIKHQIEVDGILKPLFHSEYRCYKL